GVVDGGLEQFFPWQLAKTLVHGCPTCSRSRNGDAVDAVSWHSGDAFGAQMLRRKCLRSPSAGVDAGELARLGIPVNREHISANAVHHWFGGGEHGVGGNSSIDRRSAFGQNVRPRLR